MAILDRIKKRIETDLDDTELQLLIDEANQDIINKFGPHANSATPITTRLEGHRKKIVVDRPIDTTQAIVIREFITEYGWGETEYPLVPNDYRIWPDGYTIERLNTGTTSRSFWAQNVEIVYTPVNDGDQREEVIIKLVMLSIQYDTLSSSTIGDVTKSNADYQAERNKLLNSLQPRGGLTMA